MDTLCMWTVHSPRSRYFLDTAYKTSLNWKIMNKGYLWLTLEKYHSYACYASPQSKRNPVVKKTAKYTAKPAKDQNIPSCFLTCIHCHAMLKWKNILNQKRSLKASYLTQANNVWYGVQVESMANSSYLNEKIEDKELYRLLRIRETSASSNSVLWWLYL